MKVLIEKPKGPCECDAVVWANTIWICSGCGRVVDADDYIARLPRGTTSANSNVYATQKRRDELIREATRLVLDACGDNLRRLGRDDV